MSHTGGPQTRLVARVEGMVQGVGFRYATVRKANQIGGLTGYVRNAGDGSVEVVAEGERRALSVLEAWLNHGPAGAVVRHVETHYGPVTGRWSTFGIEY